MVGMNAATPHPFGKVRLHTSSVRVCGTGDSDESPNIECEDKEKPIIFSVTAKSQNTKPAYAIVTSLRGSRIFIESTVYQCWELKDET
jgi:hypothetical protein